MNWSQNTPAPFSSETPAWHRLTVPEIFDRLHSEASGLQLSDITTRLHQYGLNQLVVKQEKAVWLQFLLQFRDLMSIILLGAAALSIAVGDMKDAVIIFGIVILNSITGFIQERRAKQALAALKKLTDSFVKVKRASNMLTVSAADIVPGDIVLLEAGDIIPADMRVIESQNLAINEAALTGESQPVEKYEQLVASGSSSITDQVNMLFKGTHVTHGRGIGITVATGMQTVLGGIAQMLQQPETLTPLQQRLQQFGKKISILIIFLCLLFFVAGLIRHEQPVPLFLTAVSMAVAAIPEALPAVITISLALGAKRLANQHALVRKLPAVETLGSVTYICTDKTGTLTQNKMRVRDIWRNDLFPVEDLPFAPDERLLFCIQANQDTRQEKTSVKGDPTEIALVEYVKDQTIHVPFWQQKFPRVREIPFDHDRKMMTTVHQLEPDKYMVVTKGALESIRSICLNFNEEIITRSDAVSGKGQRVIAYSYKMISALPVNEMVNLEQGQYFCGFAGLIDPPRAEAIQAVADCKNAGVIPVMITGDHPITAGVIAEELGIFNPRADILLTGKELEQLSANDFAAKVRQVRVYARVSPGQKLLIVRTLQESGEFVAMTGDGVNDAPAIKRANIGIAMGLTGTDVSKEAAHMILVDDNFATIVRAIREGRRIFDNIRKFIRYTMTGNSGELWTIFLAPILGLPIPLLPIHILWINLVTDGLPGLALSKEPAEKNIMNRMPRKPKESIFSDGLGGHVILVGLLIGVICLITQHLAIGAGNGHWQTMVFTVLCFSQLGHVLAVRSESRYLFAQGLFSNMPLLAAILFSVALQLGLIYQPTLREIFSLQPLTLLELAACIAASSIVFHVVELEKFIRKRWLHKAGLRWKIAG